MPEYLAPGVYVEEVSSGIKPIEGVSTSTAGFLGRTERGPTGAKFITSFLEYQRLYGGFLTERNYLPDAVKGFFDNGGRRAYISRAISNDDKLTTASLGGLTFHAVGPGKWGEGIYLLLIPSKGQVSNKGTEPIPASITRLRLLVAYFPKGTLRNPLAPFNLDPKKRPSAPLYLEDFDNVVSDPTSADDIVAVVNRRSLLVQIDTKIARTADGFTPTKSKEEDITDPELSWTHLAIPADAPSPTEFGVGPALKYLEAVDDISILVAPDAVTSASAADIATLISSCEKLRDRIVLLSSTEDQQGSQPITHGQDSSYAAFYHPWIKVGGAVSGNIKRIPPVGHIAGICARTDITRGVHKAPANEVVNGALDLEVTISKELQDVLNPRGVNCVRDFRADGRGIRLWGARTTSSDSEWKYLNVRRLFLFLEESIDQGTQWVVFEPNSDPTWAAVRRNVSNFLLSVWRSGALLGAKPEDAFFVRCDRNTMTEDDILNGRLVCVIGVAPVRPAEFVIIRISQMTSEAKS